MISLRRLREYSMLCPLAEFSISESDCLYNDGWSCPITPPENRLKVAIRAGEMTPQGAWVEEA